MRLYEIKNVYRYKHYWLELTPLASIVPLLLAILAPLIVAGSHHQSTHNHQWRELSQYYEI